MSRTPDTQSRHEEGGSPARPPSTVWQYAFAAAITTAIIGLWIDIWGHIHEATKASETFFTPWHMILYGGIGAAGLLLGGLWLARRRRRESLPDGLEVSIAGVLLFGLGGASDMVWHALFGVEANLEALLSPTHMAIYIAGFLVFVGPLRMRRLARVQDLGWTAALPAVVSVTMIVQLVTVFGQFANPVAHPNAALSEYSGIPESAREMSVAFGYLGVAMTTLVVSGLVLGLSRYMALPRGAWIVILGLSTVGIALAHDQARFTLIGLIAGLAAELGLGGSNTPGPIRLRLTGALVPLAWSAVYFAIIAFTDSIAWTPHIVASSLVLPTFLGFVLSLLVAPLPALDRWPMLRAAASTPGVKGHAR